ncbi:DUF5914 domain-containing protein [Streptomyces sp. Caat 7-52]|uniref:DUF5914 domain-containing protein n=1 Tax=Streptomyces sp. Caat 7-52 TaxID=2949637 RepID=UPI00203604D5|nr:DUF5914 domain-containing protein [Streptomyces sp. Caat 7-52]
MKRALARPSGNWYVVGASDDLRDDRPLARTVQGREVVVWRGADGRAVGGPGVCPHLGAPLRDSPVRCGALVCHWHGLALYGTPYAGWAPLPVHDDGVLLWVRLDEVGGEAPLDTPVVPRRPERSRALTAVYVGTGVCEVEDIVANRLDPWHGAWFHPYAFLDLRVVGSPEGPEAGPPGRSGGGSPCASGGGSPCASGGGSPCASGVGPPGGSEGGGSGRSAHGTNGPADGPGSLADGTNGPADGPGNSTDGTNGPADGPGSSADGTNGPADDPGGWEGCPDGSACGTDDAFTVDVSFKVAGRLVVPVRAVFTAPEPRTVVMRIVEGEGEGSVVETHATPLGPDELGRPRTAVTEAVIAASDRPGFAFARRAAPLLRPLVRRAAGRLWRDDLAYAERRWQLRSTGRFPG